MKGIKLVPNKPLTELQKLKVDNTMLRQEVASLKKQLKLYGVVKSLKDKEAPHYYDWLKENKVDFFCDLFLYKDDWLTIGDLYVKYKKEFNIPF